MRRGARCAGAQRCGSAAVQERSIRGHKMKTMTAPVQGMNFATCATSIEKHLGTLPPISQVNASYVTQTVTITYDEHRMDEETLRALVEDCGFACGQPMTASHLLHAAAEAERAGVPVSLARATADDVAVVKAPAPARAPTGTAAGVAPMPAQEHAVPEHAVQEHAAHAAMDMDMDMDME